MSYILDGQALDLLFRKARTHNCWLRKPVSDDTLYAIHSLMRCGPTSANCQPARLVFVRSLEAKKRLRSTLMEGNIDKTMTAPVTVIVGYDLHFYKNLSYVFPHIDAKAWFVGNDALIQTTSFRNGTLQGAYLIMAARALGLDCGPMSGFNNVLIDQIFFPDGTVRSNFLCNLGYGDSSNLQPYNPRLSFSEQCQIV